jgi:hypothetical protein
MMGHNSRYLSIGTRTKIVILCVVMIAIISTFLASAETLQRQVPPLKSGVPGVAILQVPYSAGDDIKWSWKSDEDLVLTIIYSEDEREHFDFVREGSGQFHAGRDGHVDFRFSNYNRLRVWVDLEYEVINEEKEMMGSLVAIIAVFLIFIILVLLLIRRRKRVKNINSLKTQQKRKRQYGSLDVQMKYKIDQKQTEPLESTEPRQSLKTQTVACWYCGCPIDTSSEVCNECGKPNWDPQKTEYSSLKDSLR